MQQDALSGVFDEIVRGAYHHCHFVGLRAVQNRPIKMLYAKILPHPAFCAQPLDHREQGPFIHTQLDERQTSDIGRVRPG